MRVLIIAVVLIVLFVWMTITSIAGLLFVPLVLLLVGLFGTTSSKNEAFDSNKNLPEVTPDHHIHVPLEKVPSEYYEAYSAYLKSKEWRVFRKTVLKRDRYRCVDCNVYGYNIDTNPLGPLLQVHHIHYDGIETMAFTTDQCVSVCPECHDKRHGR